ncbi:MAG: hypothetical protein KIS77_03220 [Saprospiraceae bacterium]|nr:hypothetical protein [Saprospiraceae bacterium]
MKAPKKIKKLEGWAIGVLLFLSQTGMSQSFLGEKNLFPLREATYTPIVAYRLSVERLPSRYVKSHQTEGVGSPIFLPRWSAERLPFFCRIEHDVAKRGAVPFKFRLGSAEYVDWLEGKGSRLGRAE